MAGTATVVFMGVSAIAGTASAIINADASRKAAHQQEDAAIRQAQQAQQRAAEEERIAKEKKDFELKLASEQMEFEKTTRKEKTDFITGQMSKQTAELRAAAIAGYAASGIDIAESGSPLAVLERIQEEGAVERGAVTKEFTDFVASRELEYKQLEESSDLSYDWFTSRLHRETEWEVQNKYAEASAYRSQADYATYGGYFNTIGAAAGGASKTYKAYKFYNA